MGVKTFSDNNAEVKYNFHRKAGRSIIERRPIFSPDGEYVILTYKYHINVFFIHFLLFLLYDFM